MNNRTDEVMIQRKKITLCTKIDKSLKMHLFCVLLTCPVMAGVSQSQENITDSEKDVGWRHIRIVADSR